MKKLDYFLRNRRYSVVEPFIPDGSDILDIGGYDGSLLFRIRHRIKKGFCIDPLIQPFKDKKLEFIKAKITGKLPFPEGSFDVVTMLAVFEHLGDDRNIAAAEAHRILRKGGVVILTIPHQNVDNILKVMTILRLIDGMSVEEHDNYNISQTDKIFQQAGFSLRRRERFQLGLNNLFVFGKAD